MRIAELALTLPSEVRDAIWSRSDEIPVAAEHLPMLGREIAAESLVEMGHRADGLDIAARAIQLDDAQITARALKLILGPALIRNGGLRRLTELVRSAETSE